MSVTDVPTDLELLHSAEAALLRGEREEALSLLTDLSAMDTPVMMAQQEVYDENFDLALIHVRRAIGSRKLVAAVA